MLFWNCSKSEFNSVPATSDLDLQQPVPVPEPLPETQNGPDGQIYKPWPLIYVLQRFPDHLHKLLEGTNSLGELSRSIKNKAVQVLYEDLLQYGL